MDMNLRRGVSWTHTLVLHIGPVLAETASQTMDILFKNSS